MREVPAGTGRSRMSLRSRSRRISRIGRQSDQGVRGAGRRLGDGRIDGSILENLLDYVGIAPSPSSAGAGHGGRAPTSLYRWIGRRLAADLELPEAELPPASTSTTWCHPPAAARRAEELYAGSTACRKAAPSRQAPRPGLHSRLRSLVSLTFDSPWPTPSRRPRRPPLTRSPYFEHRPRPPRPARGAAGRCLPPPGPGLSLPRLRHL
jgi:hypothetical protein